MADDDRKRRIAADCFKKGTEALSKESWEFAVAMMKQAVNLDPGNLLYRQTLRGAEYRRYNNNKTGAGGMSFLSMNSARSRVKKGRSRKEWDEMDKAAEDGLELNPWDAQLNADAGDACRERGYGEVAAFCYSKASEAAPENKDYLKTWAEILENRNDFDNAIKVVERLARLDPQNGTIRGWISKLHTSKTIVRGGFDVAESTKEIQRKEGYEASVTGGKGTGSDSVAPGESQEMDLKQAIRKNPKDKNNYLKLADLYRRENRLDDALTQAQAGYEVSNDPNIQELVEDLELEIDSRALETVRQRAAKGDAAAKEQAGPMAGALLEKQLGIYAERITRYPADMKLKYEQGQRLVRAKRFQEATRLLQQASADPRLEAPVLLMLGKCFLAQKQNGLALKQLEKAAPKFSGIDQPDPFKECWYFIGRLREESGNEAGAIDAYTEVIGVDYEYKDARERMEKLQGRDDESDGLSDLIE